MDRFSIEICDLKIVQNLTEAKSDAKTTIKQPETNKELEDYETEDNLRQKEDNNIIKDNIN